MKLTKCPQSHFYDADKYDDCPHCSAKQGTVRQSESTEQPAVRTTTQSTIPQTQSQQTARNGMTVSFKQAVNRSGFESPSETPPPPVDPKPKAESVDDALHAFAKLGSSIFRKQPEEKQPETQQTPKTDVPPPQAVTPPVQQPTVTPEAPVPSPKAVTPPVQQPTAAPAAPVPPPKAVTPPVQQPTAAPAAPVPPSQAVTPPVQQPTAAPAAPVQSGGLAQAVAAAKAKPAADDGRTVAYYQFADSEPVVGWLIGLSGFYFGESFNLKAGHNFIGRALSMDVALVEEKSVSREYHANIIYDPKSRKFFIQPGRSNGLTYLNGELLMTPAELHIYNRIQLGDHTYIFMPFCGRNFSWEDYINED